QAPLGEPALDANAVSAQGIHVLEGGVGIGQPAAEAGAAEALADDVAVLHRAHPSSSPRAAFFRYGGKRQALSADMRPPSPSPASAALSSRSPARRRGSTRSKVVAWENIPQVGMPSTGRSPIQARKRRLPGCAGTPWRSMRPPARSMPRKTGSSGSSALAPAMITRSAPSPIRASMSAATAPASPPE